MGEQRRPKGAEDSDSELIISRERTSSPHTHTQPKDVPVAMDIILTC